MRALLAGTLVLTLQVQGARGEQDPHRTYRAGDELRETVLGRKIHVPPNAGDSVTALVLGAVVTQRDRLRVSPLGSLYLWRASRDRFFRAILAGVYNEAEGALRLGPLDIVALLDSSTLPFKRKPTRDGEIRDSEAAYWGYVRPGLGIGVRRQVGPRPYNLAQAWIAVQPGWFYARKANAGAGDFTLPNSHGELRARIRLRLDRLERNFFFLAHDGIALGLDADWTTREGEPGSAGPGLGTPLRREVASVRAYGVVVGGIPGLSEKHRVRLNLFAQGSNALTHLTAPRLGGGIQADAFGTVSRPVLPGFAFDELAPPNFALATAEYRYEVAFFLYTGPRIAWAAFRADGRPSQLGSLGWRVTTAGVLKSRLQLDYGYTFGNAGDLNFGGHELTASVSFVL